MNQLNATTDKTAKTDRSSASRDIAIFGLRYLEEEAMEIQDVVGCLNRAGDGLTCSCIDDGE